MLRRFSRRQKELLGLDLRRQHSVPTAFVAFDDTAAATAASAALVQHLPLVLQGLSNRF